MPYVRCMYTDVGRTHTILHLSLPRRLGLPIHIPHPDLTASNPRALLILSILFSCIHKLTAVYRDTEQNAVIKILFFFLILKIRDRRNNRHACVLCEFAQWHPRHWEWTGGQTTLEHLVHLLISLRRTTSEAHEELLLPPLFQWFNLSVARDTSFGRCMHPHSKQVYFSVSVWRK